MNRFAIHFRRADVFASDIAASSRSILRGDVTWGDERHAFSSPLIPFLVELLKALQCVGNRDEFRLALADDGEVELHASLEKLGSGTWLISLNLDGSTKRVTSDHLLISMLVAFSDLRAACAGAGIDIEQVVKVVPGDITWSP